MPGCRELIGLGGFVSMLNSIGLMPRSYIYTNYNEENNNVKRSNRNKKT